MFRDRKILQLVLALCLLVVPLSFVGAQAPEDEVTIQIQEFEEDLYDDTWDTDWEWESDWDMGWEETYPISSDELDPLATAAGAGIAAVSIVMGLLSIVLGLGMYIFMALALMTIAKKLNHPNPWYAWIPILNFILLLQLADLSPWLILLGFIPGLNAIAMVVLSVMMMMKICEKLGYDKLLGLLILVPLANIVLVGILAWGKKDSTPVQPELVVEPTPVTTD